MMREKAVLQRARELVARSHDVPAQPEPPPTFDDPGDLRRQRGWRAERPKPERKLDTMPVDWQRRIDEAIESERATMFEVIAHAIAEMTAEHERQLAKLMSDVASLKADHTAADLKQFGQKLDATIAKASELIDRLDRGPLDLPSPLSARRTSSVN
jgi:hypothetical protein